MQNITYAYLQKRLEQMISHLHQVFLTLGYTEQDALQNTLAAKKRLEHSDGKLYGNRNIHHLHRAKRLVRNEIRLAITYRPQRKANIERWKSEYQQRVSEHYARTPNTPVFSFEHTYAKQLRINFGSFKTLFLLSPQSAVAEAKSPKEHLSPEEKIEAAKETLTIADNAMVIMSTMKDLYNRKKSSFSATQKLELIQHIT